MDKRDESLELFEYQTGLKIEMPHINKNRKYPKPTKDEIMKLKRLMPMDLYIYEYAKQIFDRRWQMYLNTKKGTLISNKVDTTSPILVPDLPKVIDGCKSTKNSLQCPKTLSQNK